MIQTSIVNVTPDMAEKWLSRNIEHNRKINDERVNAYAREMKDGKWLVTGQAIQFDENGVLIDGQHRLQAVIKAQTPVQMLVTKGLSPMAINVIDTMQARSVNQIMRMTGASDLKANKFTISLVNSYLRFISTARKITASEYSEWFDNHKEEIGAVVYGLGCATGSGKKGGVTAPVGIALLFARRCGVDEDILRQFVHEYRCLTTSGENSQWAMKLAMHVRSNPGNSQRQMHATEEYAERCIYAYVNNMKALPKNGRKYTGHDEV